MLSISRVSSSPTYVYSYTSKYRSNVFLQIYSQYYSPTNIDYLFYGIKCTLWCAPCHIPAPLSTPKHLNQFAPSFIFPKHPWNSIEIMLIKSLIMFIIVLMYCASYMYVGVWKEIIKEYVFPMPFEDRKMEWLLSHIQ